MVCASRAVVAIAAAAEIARREKNLMRTSKVESKCVERGSRSHQNVLAPVDHISFDCVRHLAQVGVPQWLAVRGVVGHEIAVAIGAKEQFTRGGGQSSDPVAIAGGFLQPLPNDFAGAVVDGDDVFSLFADALLEHA